jgi:hypothetical protein
MLCEKMMAFRALSNRFAPFKAAMRDQSLSRPLRPGWQQAIALRPPRETQGENLQMDDESRKALFRHLTEKVA